MSHDLSLKETQKEWHGTLKSYIYGFISSLLLTILSFSLVWTKFFLPQTLIYILVTLAVIQAICQLIFFLHMAEEPKPRWGAAVFCLMVTILLIIAVGSLWVMNDLNNRMMPNMNNMDMYK